MPQLQTRWLWSFCIIGYIQNAFTAESVRAVALLTRHGDRSPVESYRTDPYADFNWPGGYGALSPKGIQQLYVSGTIKRKRFISLLKENYGLYSSENMHVQSSAIERCLASGQSFLAGFYPPPKNRNILPIRWQPVPLHSEPVEEDAILAQSRPCPNFDSTLFDALDINDPEIQELLEGNSGFFDYLANNTGEEINGYWDTLEIQDTLKVQQDNGLKLPAWADPVFESIMTPLSRIIFAQYGRAKITRIKGGALLNDILDNLIDFQKGSTQNVFIYSAHDITLISLLSVLDVVDQTEVAPHYAATISIELHQNKNIKNDLEIRFYYFRNENDEDPIKIVIKSCPEPCPLDKFSKIFKSRLVPNYDQKCNEKINKD